MVHNSSVQSTKIVSEDTIDAHAQQKACIQGLEPAVLRGFVSRWPAIRSWAGDQGLQRMVSLAGSAPVQVMSAASNIFVGHIEEHEPEMMSFEDFVCLAGVPSTDPSTSRSHVTNVRTAPAESGVSADNATRQYYLAQASINGAEQPHSSSLIASCLAHEATASAPRPSASAPVFGQLQSEHSPPALPAASLGALAADIQTPSSILELHPDSLQINLWMSIRGSRSSLHYDPYHNVLCCVRGAKRVTIHSPSRTASLYPSPLHGEAPNHSTVNFAAPDLERHPLYRSAQQQCQVAELQPGDALFLPEGWWHQVDSDDVSIAVNFWWRAPVAAALAAAVSPFHLRQVTRMLGTQRLNEWMATVQPLPQLSDAPESQNPAAASERLHTQGVQHLVITLPPATSPQGAEFREVFTAFLGAESPSAGNADVGAATLVPSRFLLQSKEAKAVSLLIVLTDRALSSTAVTRCGESQSGFSSSCDSTSSTSSTSSNSRGSHNINAAIDTYRSGGRQTSPLVSDTCGIGGHTTVHSVRDHRSIPNTLTSTRLGLAHPITRLFASLRADELCRVLLAMVAHAPASLEGLLTYSLTPAATEILLCGLETAQQLPAMQRHSVSFYSIVWGVVPCSKQLLSTLLAKKEFCCEVACRQVVGETIGY